MYGTLRNTAVFLLERVIYLLPHWLQNALVSATLWIAERDTVLGDQRTAAVLYHSLFPYLNNDPAKTLFSLFMHIDHAIERSRKDNVIRYILKRYKEIGLNGTPCFSTSSNHKAEVKLISTSLGVIDSFHTSSARTRNQVDDVAIASPTNQNKSIFLEGLEELMSKEIYRHWIIDIPNRRMTWHLVRDEHCASTKIECANSPEILNTAVLGVRLRGKDSKPLRSTFVSNEYIIRIIEIEG